MYVSLYYSTAQELKYSESQNDSINRVHFIMNQLNYQFCFRKKSYNVTKRNSERLYEIRDVEAVEYFLLPLPAQYQVSRFRVYFRFQFLSSKCFRFHKSLTAYPCRMFYEKCFRFRLLKKSNASEFASPSRFFLQSASASIKI